MYFVFVSQNLQLVVDHHFGPRDYHFYMAIVLPAVLVLCSVKARTGFIKYIEFVIDWQQNLRTLSQRHGGDDQLLIKIYRNSV